MDKLKTRIAVFILKFLASLGLKRTQKLGAFLGRLTVMFNASPAKVTAKNISLCFPQLDTAEQKKLVRQSMEETGKVLLEFGLMWEWPVSRTLGLIKQVEGEHYIHERLARGKGLIVLAPHHGSWELTGLYLASLYPMAALYRAPKLKGLEEYMSSVRGRNGSELVPANKRGVVRLYSILRDNGMVGILPDQVPHGNSGIFAPFFNHEANTMKLVTRLIQKTGTEVVAAYAIRLENGEGFRMVVRPADEYIHSDDIAVSAAALNRTVELCVFDEPAQYQWEYKRFKDFRPDHPRVY